MNLRGVFVNVSIKKREIMRNLLLLTQWKGRLKHRPHFLLIIYVQSFLYMFDFVPQNALSKQFLIQGFCKQHSFKSQISRFHCGITAVLPVVLLGRRLHHRQSWWTGLVPSALRHLGGPPARNGRGCLPSAVWGGALWSSLWLWWLLLLHLCLTKYERVTYPSFLADFGNPISFWYLVFFATDSWTEQRHHGCVGPSVHKRFRPQRKNRHENIWKHDEIMLNPHIVGTILTFA